MTFGARVRQLRHARGLTIRQVAEAVERDFTYVSKIENDRVLPPSAGVIVKLADLLGCDAEELATLGDKPPVAVLRRRLAHAEAEVDRLRAENDRLRSAGGRFHREVRELLEETYSSHGRPLSSTHAGGIRDDLYGAANRFRIAVTGSLNGDFLAAPRSAEPEPPPEPRE